MKSTGKVPLGKPPGVTDVEARGGVEGWTRWSPVTPVLGLAVSSYTHPTVVSARLHMIANCTVRHSVPLTAVTEDDDDDCTG